MLPDRVSNPGTLTYESGALPIALRGPATLERKNQSYSRYLERESPTKINTNNSYIFI